MRPFETFDHTADIGLVARGATPEELFANAALGLVDLMVDPKDLREETRLELSVSAQDREALLVTWLNELLYLLDAQGFVPRRSRILSMSQTELTAELRGERIDRSRHHVRHMVKAVTYHDLQITHSDGLWEARVIVDL